MSDFETLEEQNAYYEGYDHAMQDAVVILCDDALKRVSWEDRTKILNYLLSAVPPQDLTPPSIGLYNRVIQTRES